jgi:hypothetical protein
MVFQGGALIRQARRDLEANLFDLTTGLLLPDGVTYHAQSFSSLSGIDPKSSHIPTPQLQQPSPQSLQSGVPQHQNLQSSQQQHQQQPEEGLAGEIDHELAAVLDKSPLVVCLETSFNGICHEQFFRKLLLYQHDVPLPGRGIIEN